MRLAVFPNSGPALNVDLTDGSSLTEANPSVELPAGRTIVTLKGVPFSSVKEGTTEMAHGFLPLTLDHNIDRIGNITLAFDDAPSMANFVAALPIELRMSKR